MRIDRSEDPKEQRVGRLAGVTCFASLLCTVAALVIANSASNSPVTEPGARGSDIDGDRARALVDFHDTPTEQALATGLRALGVLLCIAVGLYLLWLLRRRGAEVGPVVSWSVVLGPLLVVAASVFGFFAFSDVADTFVASGSRTPERARALIDGDSALDIAGPFDILARIVFAIWIGMLSAHAMRTGLFTSFLGYWGIACAGALVILPIGDAMFIGWLASTGFLALGYWPGGRPPAWDRAAAVSPGPAV